MVNGEHSAVNGLSQAAIGRALGMSPANMTKLKKQGMPVDSVESAQAWRVARQNIAARKATPALSGCNVSTEPSHPRPPTPPGPKANRVGGDEFRDMIRAIEVNADGGSMGEDFDSARTREKVATANLAEMEEAALRGKYLEKADVDASIFEIARAMRDGLTNCARRIAAEVSTLTTADACETVIEREHRALLDSMAHQIGVRLGAGSQVEATT